MNIVFIVWKLKKKYKNTDNGPYYLTFGLNNSPFDEIQKIYKTKVNTYYEFHCWFVGSFWSILLNVWPWVHKYEHGIKEEKK